MPNTVLLHHRQPTNNADFIVPIDIEGKIHPVYVLKRPHVDEFLESVGKLYECVLFTASLAEVSYPGFPVFTVSLSFNSKTLYS